MRKGVAFLTLILLINLILVYKGNSQTGRYNYVSSNYFSFTIFKNYKGFSDWKKDFLNYQHKVYEKVKVRNFNETVFKLKGRIKRLTDAYLKNREAAYHYHAVKIPVLLLSDGREMHKHLELYHNGKIVKPLSYTFIGEIEVNFSQSKGKYIQVSSKQKYRLYIFTFDDQIANKQVIFSINNQVGMKQGVTVGEGFLPRHTILPFD